VNIINFSRTKKFKIILIAVAVVGVLFVILGTVFLLSDVNIKATSINLQASGLTYNQGRYNLDVNKKQTAITVNTEPGNRATAPVRFSVVDGGDCATVTNSVYSGGIAILTLKEDKTNNNAFKYGGQMNISVSCGNLPAVILRVTISVPEEQVDIALNMYKNGTEPKVQISAHEYLTEALSAWSPYKLERKFTIWNTPVGENNVTWSETCLDGEYGIRLFGDTGFTNIKIPTQLLQMILSKENKTLTLRFQITARYLNKDYIDYFALEIVE
jgi:hypothetical protein